MKNFFSALVLGVSVISLAVSAHADNKLYTSLGLGYAAPEDMPKASTFDEIFGVIPAGTSGRTDDNYGGRIAIGYMLNTEATLSYGLETAAAYYGVSKYSNNVSSVEMNYYGLELLGVAQLSLDKVRLIGKLGASDEQFHPTKSNIQNNSGFTSSQQVLPEVGAGIAYMFTPSLQVGLSFYHVFGSDVSFDNNADATALPSVNLGLLEIAFFL